MRPALRAGVGRAIAIDVPSIRKTVVIADDEDRIHTDALARALASLGYVVEVVRSQVEAFGLACARDLDAIAVSARLRDGSSLVLPVALGIRRPPVVILVTAMADRIPPAVARRAGFDARLTKVVDARAIDGLVQSRRRGGAPRPAPPVRRDTPA